jgi:methyl-accepting chemotaxis protein
MKLVNNMKLGSRLGITMGCLAGFIVLVALLGWTAVVSLNASTGLVMEQSQKAKITREIGRVQKDIYLLIWSLLNNDEHAYKLEYKAQLVKLRETNLEYLDELSNSSTTEMDKQLLAKIEGVLVEVKQTNSRVIDLGMANKEAEAKNLFLTEGAERMNKLDSAIAELTQWRDKQMADTEAGAKATTHRMKLVLAIGSVLSLIIAAVFSILVTKSVTVPIGASIELLERISQGDLTRDIPDELRTRHDEAGNLARSLQMVSGNLTTTLNGINKDISTLATAAGSMTDIAVQLSTSSEVAGGKAHSVSSAAEEIHRNMENVAAAMEQATSNVDIMAAATEEMSASVYDISQKTKDASAKTRGTSGQAREASTRIEVLGKAAEEIGSVTDTIKAISDKTNLLALNATIEAARAGEAGKGFAVVANEIKELARQTADATADIASRLKGIQTATKESVSTMDEISGAIHEVDAIVVAIDEAMGQQTKATHEIAENVTQASQGLKEINVNVNQAASAISHVAQEITELSETVGEVANCGSMVERNAKTVNGIVSTLTGQMSQFKFKGGGFSAGAVKLAHGQWKTKLADMLSGKITLTPGEIADHHNCAFGKFYFGEGTERFGRLPVFQEIDPAHKKIHDTAKEIARLFNEGRQQEAKTLFHQFDGMTGQLFALLDRLEDNAKA